MLKKDIEWLKEKREQLGKKYIKNTNNEKVKKELLKVNDIISFLITFEYVETIKKNKRKEEKL